MRIFIDSQDTFRETLKVQSIFQRVFKFDTFLEEEVAFFKQHTTETRFGQLVLYK